MSAHTTSRTTVDAAAGAGHRSVLDMVAEHCARRPQATAILCADRSSVVDEITYGEMWAASAVVSGRITELPGFARGCAVATRFPRGIAGVVAQLGIWRAGAAYVPLDGALPEARIATILADARPCGVVTPTPGGAWADVDVEPRAVGLPDDGVPEDGLSDDGLPDDGADRGGGGDPSYIVYTSGSTGTPKGISVGHRSLANLVRWHIDTYGTGPGTRAGAFAGLGFDVTAWEVWAALGGGATLVMPSDVSTVDVEALRDFLDRWSVVECFLSSPLAERMFAVSPAPRTLRVLTTGADRLRLHPPADFPAGVYNHYGPTETTVLSVASGDLRAASRDGLPVIGRPIRGARVRLVDPDGGEVTDVGGTGELLIGGVVLALGYRCDDDLTRAKFRHDPDGARWYHSGDICRWNVDGDLEFVGRADMQVKVRGNRVELAEIEQAMLTVPGVPQAAVMLRADQDGGELVGFFSGSAEPEEVRAAVAALLPEYMVPSTVHRVVAVPLNHNGKTDRAALPSLVPAAPEEPVAEPGGLPERVARLWAEVLGHTPGPQDNFFEIGGHSLKAARLVGLVRDEFDVPLSLDVMFSHPVLDEFVDQIAALSAASDTVRGE